MAAERNAWPVGWGLIIALICVVLSLGGSASGKPTAAMSAPSTDALIERGVAALHAKELPTAQSLFEAAYLQEQRPLLLFHLGQVAQSDGRPIDAEDYFRRFIFDPNVVSSSPEYALAQAALNTLPTSKGELTVQGSPLGVVRIDNRLVGVLPLSHPVTLVPGAHNLTLTKGKRTTQATVSILEDRPTSAQFGTASDYVLVSHPPVVVVEVRQEVPDTDSASKLRDQMENAVRRAGLAIRPLSVILAKQPQFADYLATLETPREQTLLGKADFVLLLQQRRSVAGPIPTCSLRVAMYAPEVLLPATEVQVDMPCTARPEASRIAPLLDQVIGNALSRPRGTLQIIPQPLRAEVRVHDILLRSGTKSIELWHGTYDVAVQLAGHQAAKLSVVVDSSEPKIVPVNLVPLVPVVRSTVPTPQPVQPPRRPLWRMVTGGVLLAGSAVMLGVGGYATVIDGRCVAEPMAPVSECPHLVDSKSVGIGMLSAGAGLLIGGGLLMTLPVPSRNHSGQSK